MKEKLEFFPITMFAIVMGLTGLTIAFGKFYHMQWLPKIFYEIMLGVVLLLFSVIGVLYLLKAVYHTDRVREDFRHRIRVNITSTISISILLLSIAFYTYFPLLGVVLWWLGTLLHTWLMYKTVTFWIEHNFEIHHFNPTWFIPVVGNILVPVVGVDLVPPLVTAFYFAAGMFFWMVLFTVFLYRAVFHAQLPGKFVPTFFVLLAPPAVGFISYMRIAASWDMFAVSLYLIALFFVGMLLFLARSFFRLNFFLSWWVFTFPLAAMTIASVVAFQVSGDAFFRHSSWVFLVATIAMDSVVSWRTLAAIREGKICVTEE
jgi:tellurite resistance protein